MREPLSKKIVEIEPSGIRKFFDMVSEIGRKESIPLNGEGLSIRPMRDLRS